MRTLRHRESKKIAQIHTASESQSLPLNLDFSAPESLPVTLYQREEFRSTYEIGGYSAQDYFHSWHQLEVWEGFPKAPSGSTHWTHWKPSYSSVQFSSVAQSYLTLQPHGLQHARPPCPSPTPRVYPNSCPLLIFMLMVYYRKRRQIKVSQGKTCKGQSTGRSQTQNFH